MSSKPADKGCDRTVVGTTQGACWEAQRANAQPVLESPSARKQTLGTKVCHQLITSTARQLLPIAERWLPLPLPHSLLRRQSIVQGHPELQVPLTTSERGLFQETTPMSPDNSTWKEGEQREVRHLATSQTSFTSTCSTHQRACENQYKSGVFTSWVSTPDDDSLWPH